MTQRQKTRPRTTWRCQNVNSCACIRCVLDIWVDTTTWYQVLLPGGARDHTQDFAHAKQALCLPFFSSPRILHRRSQSHPFCDMSLPDLRQDLCAGTQGRQTLTNRFTELSPVKTEWGQKLRRLHGHWPFNFQPRLLAMKLDCSSFCCLWWPCCLESSLAQLLQIHLS